MGSPLQHPVMLDDLTRNFQRLSATLPPDDWEPDSPKFYLHRQDSGILDLIHLDMTDDNSTVRTSVNEMRLCQTEKRELLRPIFEEGGTTSAYQESSTGRRRWWPRILPFGGCWNFRARPTIEAANASESVFTRIKMRILFIWPFHKRRSEKESARLERDADGSI